MPTISLNNVASKATADAHYANTSNPHSVTKAQVGLSNVDNTSDANKPVSTAQATAIAVVQADINAHEARTDNPHSVTKTQVGLGNVDNTSDANKPVSTAQQTALDLKLNKSSVPCEFILSCSDLTTALTTGTTKAYFRAPYAFTLTAVRASLGTTQTSGNIFTVDINESGTSVLSTKLTIDNTEKTSTTAATAPVISDSAIADDAEITIDIDQVGDGTAKGLIVTLIGTHAV